MKSGPFTAINTLEKSFLLDLLLNEIDYEIHSNRIIGTSRNDDVRKSFGRLAESFMIWLDKVHILMEDVLEETTTFKSVSID